MTAIIFPTRFGEEYVPVLDMGRESFQQSVAQRAMFGSAAIFVAQRGYATQDGLEYVRFKQGEDHSTHFTSVDIHSDGTLVWRSAVGNEDRDLVYSLMRQFVINEDDVRSRLQRFWGFASDHYASMESSPLISSLYAVVAMSNIGQKYLGKWPQNEPRSGMQMPMSAIDDPLMVPATPMKVARADLADAEKLADRFLGLLLRAFKASGREFNTAKMSGW